LIAQRQFQGLDRLFLRTLGQAMAMFVLIALAADAGVAILTVVAPRLAARMVSPQLFALLVLAVGANFVVLSLGILLRSFKREPYLWQSLAVASLTLLLAAFTAPRWGNTGVTLSYLAATAGIALPSALMIFARARRRYLSMEPMAVSGGEAA
jgi:NADH:ubiquinone oxidoreductase subunit K